MENFGVLIYQTKIKNPIGIAVKDGFDIVFETGTQTFFMSIGGVDDFI